jgi:predicted AAA+ superfamily ATPase
MIASLKSTYLRLLDELDINTFRYLYSSFSLNDGRLIGLVGPRGVGKTTLLLQFIKNRLPDSASAFYFSADHIYFNRNTILEFVTTLYEEEDIRTFFIDEIHKYGNWNQELKNLYDSFPNITVVFSGCSSLDLIKGSYDLSRRAVIHHLRGLSFREYLNFSTGAAYEPILFSDILNNPGGTAAKIASIPRLKGLFKEYLRQGYYPFVFEDKTHFFSRLDSVINKTIHEDIANHYNLKTKNLQYFKKILSFLATIPPGNTNIHNLANNLGIDSKTTLHYVQILHDTGLIRIVSADQKGSRLLRSPEKIFLDNPTLLHALCDALGHEPNPGTMRELAFVCFLNDAGHRVFGRKKRGDFNVAQAVFEIGGRNKNNTQIRNADQPAFLVKDDVLAGGKKTIPLHMFGFLL